MKELLSLMVIRDFVAKNEIYKILSQKREDLYYRINKLFEYEVLITNKGDDQELGIRPDLKEKVRKILPPSEKVEVP